MIKSISKLMAAAVLALALPCGVNAQKAAKMSAANNNNRVSVVQTRVSADAKKTGFKPVTTKRQARPNDGIVRMLDIKTASARQNKMAFAPAKAMSQATAPLYGFLVYSTDATATNGVNEISTTTAANPVAVSPELDFTTSLAGAAYNDGKIYFNVYESFWGYVLTAGHGIIDTETWEMIEYISEDVVDYELTDDEATGKFALEMAYCTADNMIYGCFNKNVTEEDEENEVFYAFSKQDPSTFETTEIAPLQERWDAVDFDKDGNLFAITGHGDLIKVNKETGASTLVASTGIETSYLGSGAIDKISGVFYWNANTESSSLLVAVSIATGEAKVLYAFENEEELFGMYMGKSYAVEGAPSFVSDFKAAFDGPSLTGVVSFTSPVTCFDGSDMDANAELTYTLTVDGETYATGATTAGKAVSIDVTVAEGGMHTFTAYVSNAAGNGPKASESIFLGNDTPKAPANVALDYTNGVATVTWDAVTEGVNDGYVTGVVYDVIRYFGGVATPVAVSIDACTFSEEIAEPTDGLMSLSYLVVAKTAAAESAASASNALSLGVIVPPCGETINESTFGHYTIIDANSDGKEWKIVGDFAQMNYNVALDMDDWMISPAIRIEGEKYYKFSIVCKAQGGQNYPERIEVKLGNAPTAEAMTEEIVEPTVVDWSSPKALDGAVFVEESGSYYIGIHGISDADMYYLTVESWSLSAPISLDAPLAATDLKIVATPEDPTVVVVSFTAPKSNVNGDDLTSLTKAEVYCDGELVATIANPTPGASVSTTVSGLEKGSHDFSVIVYNEAGAGEAANAKGFVGINAPLPVEDAVVVEKGNSGEVVITWEAPAFDISGTPIKPDQMTYSVMDMSYEIIATDLTETSFTYQACAADEQDFVCYIIFAESEGGESSGVLTNMIAVGMPLEMPVAESFSNGSLSMPMATLSDGASWAIATNDTFGDLTDADDSNGFAYMTGDYLDDAATLFTFKIDLNKANPALTFNWYALNDDDENVINIYVMCEGETYDLATVEQSAEEAGWYREVVDLSEFAGKTVQISFEGIVLAYKYIFMDNIKVATLADYDLEAGKIQAPAKVAPDTEFFVSTTVSNIGGKAYTDAYTVELVCNGKVAASLEGHEVEPGESVAYTFPQTFSVVSPEENVYQIRIVAAADEVADNNATEEWSVILDTPNYPTVADLKFDADSETSGVLSWTAPNVADAPKLATTDDFESYDAWAYSNLGDWLLVDCDGAPMGGVQGMTIPGLTTGSSTVAFFVMNSSGLNQTFESHSGIQHMSTMFNYDGSKNDDWMISPELSGEAQTISFYAKSYTAQYGYEAIEVLYSTTDQQVESFTSVMVDKKVPEDWTLFTADLPAGAKYFAIRCISQDTFMLFVDDVTYVPADAETMNLTIEGYNIYDATGKKLNSAPVTETSFNLDNVKVGDTFYVSVVFTAGESAVEEIVISDMSGLADVFGKLSIKVVGHNIVINGAAGDVNVYTADGKTIYNAAKENNTVNVAPGVYVVKAGKTVRKVTVR